MKRQDSGQMRKKRRGSKGKPIFKQSDSKLKNSESSSPVTQIQQYNQQSKQIKPNYYIEALNNINSLRNLGNSSQKSKSSIQKFDKPEITRANRIRASPELRNPDFRGSDKVTTNCQNFKNFKLKSKLSEIHRDLRLSTQPNTNSEVQNRRESKDMSIY